MKTLYIQNNRVVQVTLATDLVRIGYAGATAVDVADNFVVSVGDTYTLPATPEFPSGFDASTVAPYLGEKSADWLAAENAAITAGTRKYPANSSVTVDGVLYKTTGTAAFLAASGGGTAAPAQRVSNVGMIRLYGMGATFSAQGGNNTQSTKVGKECLDAPITAVRLWVFSKEPIAESSGWDFAVAPTDQYLNDSANNAYRPQVRGTIYNIDADAAADHTAVANQYGWRRGQWGGQRNAGQRTKSGILRPGSRFRNQSLASGYTPVVSCIVSDWIDLKTVPAADGRHYFLWKLVRNAVQGETAAFATDFTNWKLAAAEPWYRRQFVRSGGGDMITDVTTVLAATPTEANYAWDPGPIAWECRYDRPVRTVAACGDSITEGGGLQLYNHDNWLNRACLTMSTAAKPVCPVNLGFSSSTSPNYFGQLEQMYANGFRPTDVVIPNASYNDFGEYGSVSSGTQYLLSQCIARASRMIEMIRAHGGTPYLYSDFHNLALNSVTPAYNTLHAELYAWTQRVWDSGAAKKVDFRAVWQSSYDDGVHMTPAGIAVAADVLRTALGAQ